MCDVPASECTSWGAGPSVHDHCNAHSNPYYKALKDLLRQHDGGPLAAPAPASACQAAAPAWVPKEKATDGIEAEHLRFQARFGLAQAQAKAKALPPPVKVCRLKGMPDPARDRDLLLLVSGGWGWGASCL